MLRQILIGESMKTSVKAVAATGAFMCALQAAADGRLEGRVSDAAGKVYFDGAIVRLKELKLESSSNNGGRFSFGSVPAGTYTLMVDYLGAESVQQQVSVVDNRISSQTVRIGRDAAALENIIVVGQAAGASSALNKQRAADNLVSVVSADSIGQFPDENVSEALQRVSGVFIERDQGEGRFVGIRGASPNLNTASINGISIPAPESDRRSVALDVIPSGLLEGLEVTKTVTPDMDGGNIGGNIEVKSLSAFDRDGMSYQLSAEGNYNELKSETSPKVAGTFTNLFDVGEGQVGVAAALSWQDRDFGSQNIESGGDWETDIEDSGVRGLKSIEQRDYTINRQRLGAALNLDWRPSATSEYYLRSLYSHFEDQEYRQSAEYKFDDGDLETIDASSAEWSDAEMERALKDRYEEQKILSVSLGGLNMVDDWTIEYRLGYSKSSENEPDARESVFAGEGFTMGYRSAGDAPNVYADDAAYDPANFELDEVSVANNYTEEKLLSYQFDITRDMDFGDYPGYIKFGGKFTDREKSADANEHIYDDFGAAGDPTMGAFSRGQVSYDLGRFGPGISASAINSLINNDILANGIDFQDDGDVGEAYHESIVASARDFHLEEDVTAFYLMSRMDIHAMRLVYGVRYESTDFTARGYDARLIESEDGFSSSVDAVEYESDYDYLLPSINARYRLGDSTIVRAAYSQTIARPSFGALSPTPEEISIEDDELSVEAGNPELEPYESENFDLMVEYYPGNIGVLSAGLFYKKIDNFIFTADVSDVVDASVYAPGLTINDSEIIMPMNGKGADLYGLELSYTKSFDSGFLVQANATFTDSDADLGLGPDADRDSDITLPEQAEVAGNLVLGYETGPLSMRLSAAYKGETLMELDLEDKDNDIYLDDHLQLDFSARYDLTRNLQLYFNAINLTDEPMYLYQGNSRYNAQYEEYGASFVLGLTYRNF